MFCAITADSAREVARSEMAVRTTLGLGFLLLLSVLLDSVQEICMTPPKRVRRVNLHDLLAHTVPALGVLDYDRSKISMMYTY